MIADVQGNPEEALIRRAVDAFNEDDIDAFVDIWHPEAQAFGEPQVADRPLYRGPAGIREWVAESRRRWTRSRFHFRSMEMLGPVALAEIDLVGETESGGGAWRLAFLMTFRDGRLDELHTFASRDAAVRHLTQTASA